MSDTRDMRIYVVEYAYDPSIAAIKDELRPSHRAFMRELESQGRLLSTGKLIDSHSTHSLSLVLAENANEALEILDDDPYYTQGFVTKRIAREWMPVVGTFANEHH